MPDGLGRDHETPITACTACGHVMDRASGVGTDDDPSAGDFSLCIRCGHLMVFGAELQLRDPTDDEMRQIAGNKNLLALSKALAELHKSGTP